SYTLLNDAPPGRLARRRALPPGKAPAANTVTACPLAAAVQAASIPANPAPTTTTFRGVRTRSGCHMTSSGAATRGLLSHASAERRAVVRSQHVLHDTQ